MKKFFLIGITALALASCGGKKTDDGARGREYGRMLGDSIAITQQEIDSCGSQIKILNENTATWLRDFTTVSNPREVGSYMIYTPFKDRYPLRSTGLVARINDTGKFELVAALSRGTFNQIEVRTGDMAIASEVVPNDQALNYRTDALTTVSFTGAKADSIGQLIADNALNDVKVVFLENRIVVSWNMPADYRKMIMATWMLSSVSSEANRLERRVQMLHEKINILRTHKDKGNEQGNQGI